MSNEKNDQPPTNDESDEEDEDYVPEPDAEADIGEHDDHADEHDASGQVDASLSEAKRKVVDEAFDSLFGTANKRQKVDNALLTGGRKKGKVSDKKKKLLANIFGKNAAENLISSASSGLKKKKRKTRESLVAISDEKLNMLMNGVKQQKRVTEVKRFAGQDVRVEVAPTSVNGTVSRTEGATDAAAPVQRKTGGLDKVLSELSGPQKISTVTKTSSDWDQFKDKHGLDDELQKKAQDKDAYLVKKEFLQRVDLRRFEHEKADREMKRAARDAN
mmetsp:Transcript_6809/g.9978  ORF Transcript_6809/g.9978 Transcript_6809/m.9978 type:complete len:274 (+) Transcript_6809:57-878(+)